MVRQRNVNVAYTPLNRPASSSNGTSKVFAVVAFVTFVLFFHFMGGSTGTSGDDTTGPTTNSVRKDVPPPSPVAATKPSPESKSVPTAGTKSATANASPKKSPPATGSKASTPMTPTKSSGQVEDENMVDEVIEIADVEIVRLQDEALAEDSKGIESTTTKLANSIRAGLGRFFGTAITNEEVEAVATEVQSKLNTEANTTIRTKAKQITDNEIKALDEMAKENVDVSVVLDEASAFEANLKKDIDTETTKVNSTLKKRSAEIEKAVLEDSLSRKFGKKVTIVIEEDELTGVVSDDVILNKLGKPKRNANLPTLQPTKKKHHMKGTKAGGDGVDAAVGVVVTTANAPKVSPTVGVNVDASKATTKAVTKQAGVTPLPKSNAAAAVVVPTTKDESEEDTDDNTDDGAGASETADDGATDDASTNENDDEGDDSRT